MSDLNTILNNSNNLNEALNNILDTLNTLDLPKLNYIDEEDSIDKVLAKASKVSNRVLDSKAIKNANDNLNTILEDAGSYAMMLSIPVLAMTLATGTVGYLFIAPVLAIGGFACKKYANRGTSILKTSGATVKEKTKGAKSKIKAKLKDKKEQKILESDPIAVTGNGKGKVSTYEFVSITINRIKRTIKQINDRTTYICNKLKSEDVGCSKEEIMLLLQNDVLNFIVKLKIDMNNLNRIKMETGFYPDKVNAVIIQCKYAIDTICENMLITQGMMESKLKEVTEQAESVRKS